MISKETSPEVNAEQTRHMYTFRHKATGQTRTKAANKSYENVQCSDILERRYITNPNCIHEKIKNTLNWEMLVTIQLRLCLPFCYP
jgi:hypothetical protein